MKESVSFADVLFIDVAAVSMTDAGKGIRAPLSPSAVLFNLTAVCMPEAGERIGVLLLPSEQISAALFRSV